MDPISQGALGAALPQALTRDAKGLRSAAVIGFLAGLLPDVDVFIRSSEDPLLFLEFHRQFTHSLIFIPVGGLVAAAILYLPFRKKLSFAAIYLIATLGYGTHGLLDACTTYGTQLFWPFSDTRVAWNNVSIVDPFFTLPLLIAVIAAAWKKRLRWAQAGLCYAIAYLGLGYVQNQRAEAAGWALARTRGHEPVRLEAKPTFGNLILWKVIYEANGRFYVDAHRVGIDRQAYEGSSVEKLVPSRDLAHLDRQSVQYRDVERFQWFSKDYLARHPEQPDVIGDMRYSLLPHEVSPLWGIRLRPDRPDEHVTFGEYRAEAARKSKVFWAMLKGEPIRQPYGRP